MTQLQGQGSVEGLCALALQLPWRASAGPPTTGIGRKPYRVGDVAAQALVAWQLSIARA
jgi:hypothetical protein